MLFEKNFWQYVYSSTCSCLDWRLNDLSNQIDENSRWDSQCRCLDVVWCVFWITISSNMAPANLIYLGPAHPPSLPESRFTPFVSPGNFCKKSTWNDGPRGGAQFPNPSTINADISKSVGRSEGGPGYPRHRDYSGFHHRGFGRNPKLSDFCWMTLPSPPNPWPGDPCIKVRPWRFPNWVLEIPPRWSWLVTYLGRICPSKQSLHLWPLEVSKLYNYIYI